MERCNDDQLDKLVSLISFEQKESTEEKEETQADLTHMEQKTLAHEERERLQNKLLESDLKDKEQDRDQRKDFAMMIFELMCWYLFCVFFIIILNGMTMTNFHVSDDVILALLGTTAVEVIGTFAFVARYLFGKKS